MSRRGGRPRRRLDPNAWLWIGAGALLVVVAALVGVFAYGEYYVPPRKVVLEVGDRDFKMSYFVDRARYFMQNSARRGRALVPSDALLPTLEDMERAELLRQLAPSQGLTASDQDVDEALRIKVAVLTGKILPPDIVERLAAQAPTPAATATAAPSGSPAPSSPATATASPSGTAPASATGTATAEASPSPAGAPQLFADENEYKKALRDVLALTHLSERELRDIVRGEVLLEKLRERLKPNVPATAEQVQLLVILVPSKQQADRAKARLDAGEDFGSVQEELSPNTLPAVIPTPQPTPPPAPSETPTAGGPIPIATPGPIVKPLRQEGPWVTRDTAFQPFAEAAFSTPAGRHTEIVPTDRGFGILKIVARDAARPLDGAQQEFYLLRLVDEWVKEHRQNIPVKRHLDSDKSAWAIDRITG